MATKHFGNIFLGKGGCVCEGVGDCRQCLSLSGRDVPLHPVGHLLGRHLAPPRRLLPGRRHLLGLRYVHVWMHVCRGMGARV